MSCSAAPLGSTSSPLPGWTWSRSTIALASRDDLESHFILASLGLKARAKQMVLRRATLALVWCLVSDSWGQTCSSCSCRGRRDPLLPLVPRPAVPGQHGLFRASQSSHAKYAVMQGSVWPTCCHTPGHLGLNGSGQPSEHEVATRWASSPSPQIVGP